MDVFDDIKKRLERIQDFLNLDSEQMKILLSHKRIRKSIIKSGGKEYNAWRIVHNDAEENNEFDLRAAAYIIAIKRILDAEKARGNL